MRIDLNWRKPLFYLLLPVLLFLCFVGFPPPFAPPRVTKPSQEQSQPADDKTQPGQALSGLVVDRAHRAQEGPGL